ncbi:MAG: NAD(P) transhydrogenase subunit alpha [Alphaproteobacteria bacterium]|nr:NAD(P) transhydrogenase subunit alpha [Alphaproteobacteria bacterium]
MDIWFLLTILMLACFVGYLVISSITPALHSPLMSVSNAISGIIILGALISLKESSHLADLILSYSACFFAAINIFGGFAVSQRMLEMFKTRRPESNQGDKK